MDEIHREIETEIREMNGITWGANFGINFVGQCIACSDAEGVDRERHKDDSPFTILISNGRVREG